MPSSITLSSSTRLPAAAKNAEPCEYCGGPVQIVSRPVRRTRLGRTYLYTRHCLSSCDSSRNRTWPREEYAATAMPR